MINKVFSAGLRLSCKTGKHPKAIDIIYNPCIISIVLFNLNQHIWGNQNTEFRTQYKENKKEKRKEHL